MGINMELLSPAGNFSGFLGCLNAGCDAVYLAGKEFGARAYADNFSDEEIIKAIEIAHLHGVRVYLTVNTLIKEKEFSDVLNYIEPFYEAGLDACIVQDLGLISVFKDKFPNMECHVSTQGFATGIESVRFYKKHGASRVVLARELSLKEIKEIKENCDIEIETFIHGSMCYSYSGECLFSSCLGGRSGNRGRCAGPCRQPYSIEGVRDLKLKNKYFLSMKDQCTLEILPKLIEAGIDSLKIEGRMKSPEYTAFVTKMYRKYIDLYEKDKENYRVDPKDLEELKSMYMRSEISDGYYFRKNGREMITLDNPAYSKTDETLKACVKREYIDTLKKIKVCGYVYSKVGENFSFSLDAKGKFVTLTGDVVEKALNNPTSEEDIKKQLSKFGNTPFELNELTIESDDSGFISVKQLNDYRRKCSDLLKVELLKDYDRLANNCIKEDFELRDRNILSKDIVCVANKEQLEITKKHSLNAFIGLDYKLYSEVKTDASDTIVLFPDICRNGDFKEIEKIIDACTEENIAGVLVKNYDELELVYKSAYKGMVIAGPELYAFNSESADALKQFCDKLVLPFELSKQEIKEEKLTGEYVFAYGRIPLMHTANCVQKTSFSCNKNEGDRFLYLKDRTGTDFPVLRNCDFCFNTIYNSVPTCLFDEKVFLKDYLKIISFTDEGESEITEVLKAYKAGSKIKSYTKAYFNKGVL